MTAASSARKGSSSVQTRCHFSSTAATSYVAASCPSGDSVIGSLSSVLIGAPSMVVSGKKKPLVMRGVAARSASDQRGSPRRSDLEVMGSGYSSGPGDAKRNECGLGQAAGD